MKVIDPFLDGEGVWQGTARHDAQAIPVLWHQKLGGLLFQCHSVRTWGGSVFHNHPSSEELSYVISGSGVIQDMEQNVKAHIDQGKLILIDRGEIHRIFNDGRRR